MVNMIFVRFSKMVILHFMDMNHPIRHVTDDVFREIFHSMSEGIVIVNDEGKIIVANPIAEQLFGYDPDELNGLMLEVLLPERYRGRHINFRKGFNAHPEPRRMGFGRDLTALKKNGDEFPVEISLSYTRVRGSIMVMAFISDITLRKKAEEALKHSEEQLIVYAAELEKKVHSRTEALHKTIQELEVEVNERKKAEEEVRRSLEKERELNELKTKFVSIASHEFRTPLSTVMSSASLISQYNERGDKEKLAKHVQRIKTSVNHLTSILNDFLSLGKLEEGVIDIQKETIALNDFFASIHEDLAPTLKEGQSLEVTCDPAVTEVFCDSRILRNILFNLISNSSKYSQPGERIVLWCSATPEGLKFQVSDEGIGIPEEDQKHLFDRFFRASNAGNVQGTGLGLNIVKRYVDLLGGSISFQSIYGQGSTFTVIIPS